MWRDIYHSYLAVIFFERWIATAQGVLSVRSAQNDEWLKMVQDREKEKNDTVWLTFCVPCWFASLNGQMEQ